MKRGPLTALLIASFSMPLSVDAVPAKTTLPDDVPAHHWAAPSVARVTQEKILGRDPDGRFRGDKPVTRYELAVALDRFVRYIEDSRKPLHAEITPSHLPLAALKAPIPVQQAIQHLISNGFLASNSPLLTRKGSGLVTADELSEALASVTIRISDRAEPPRRD